MTTLTHSASRNSLKKTADLGSSKANQSLMVHITWTTAAVVKITARQDFLMNSITMDTYRKQVIATPSVKVLKGTELYFVKSSIDGYYYIARVSGAGHVGCSCPSVKACKHLPLVVAFIAQPRVKQVVEVQSQPTLVGVATKVSEGHASIATPLTPEQWIELVKRNRQWQEAEKAKDLAKLAAVKAQDSAA